MNHPTTSEAAVTDARAPLDLDLELDDVLVRAREGLFARQRPDGGWRGVLDTNVSVDAEEIFVRWYLGEALPEGAADWIRSQQADDGGWPLFYAGEGSLSESIEAYLALRLLGDRPGDDHMRRAAAFIAASGGLDSCRFFTKLWLCLLGMWSWDDVPCLPVEVVLVPAGRVGSVHDFAAWARLTMVPVTILYSERPVRPVPFAVPELSASGAAASASTSAPTGPAAFVFGVVDRMLRLYQRLPRTRVHRLARERAERWLLDHQDVDGTWGGIHVPWFFAILALDALGHDRSSETFARALGALDDYVAVDDRGRRFESTHVDVWDTCLALQAVLAAGAAKDDPRVLGAQQFLLDALTEEDGDWSVRRPVRPGAWSCSIDNTLFPDSDDTAEVLAALVHVGDPASAEARRLGADWLVAMQSDDGGWGAYDVNNTRELWNSLPVADFGCMTDPPSVDVTAHALRALCIADRGGSPGTVRAAAWLRRRQRADGSWTGRWGVNGVYGTSAALQALRAYGVPTDPVVRRGERWLLDAQQPDGAWGEDPRSDTDPSWWGRGSPTPSQTGWGMLGLLDADLTHRRELARAAAWLVARQEDDGTWSEPEYTGTGFPGDFYFHYDLHPTIFSTLALGTYARFRRNQRIE